MQVSLTATGGLERRLEVAVPAQRVETEVAQRLQELTRTARLKGFRPGKIPLPVVQKQFGEQVHGEVIGDLIRASFAEAVTQEKLKPATGPRIEPITLQPGADLKYAAVFEVLPEVKIKPVADLRLDKPVARVTDTDVDSMIESMRKQMAAHEAEHAAHCENPEHHHGLPRPEAGAAPELPALDDRFASAFGVKEGGMEALRAEVRRSMERELESAARERLRSEARNALLRENPIDLPRTLVEEEVQQLQLDAGRRMGAKDVSQLPPREPFQELAGRRVSWMLLLGELIRQEDLKVDRARVLKRLNEMTAHYPNSDEVRRAYLQRADVMRQIESAVLEEQALDWVLERAQIAEKPMSFAELTGLGQNVGSEP